MEVEEIQTQGSKFPRIGRGGCNLNKLAGQNGEEENDSNRVSLGTSDFAPDGTSRIVRVSRASGGQDLHSKVGTSKGLRDRRVRLSVHTAMQFYDLQDRLGYDRPSKAVEWLLKAAAKSIDELPSINTSFPNAPNQLSDEMGSAEVDPVESAQLNGCNSETSKGSTGQLLLSRTENQIKANERRAKREEKQNETCIPLSNHLGEAPLSQSSFTELLMGSGEGANLFHEQRQWGSDPPMDYFPMAQYHSQIYNHNHHHQQELQQFPLLSDQLMPTVAAADLNFTMSSSSVLSANSDPKLVMKGITHGACDYLVKPVRQEELKNIWQHVFRRKRSEPKQQNLSNSQDTDQQANGEIANGTYPNGSSDQNGKRPDQKRKDEEEAEQEGEDNGTDNDETCSQKKPRVVWSVELHRKFVAAVYQLGINKAVPKKILELMNVEGITMENMASHLQKYRLYLKRISSTTEEEKITSGLRRKDPYMQRNSFDGVGDSRELPSKGIFSNSAMSPYQTGLILDGLNTPSGVSLLGFSSSSPLIQANNRSQSISNSFSTLSKLNLVVSQPNQHLGQEKRYVLKKTDLFPNNKENTSSQANFRQSVVENSVMDSKMRSNEYHLLEQMESQKSFESLDDFMNKQEHGGTWKEAFFHIFGRCGAKYGKDSTYDEAKFAFLANYYLRSQLGSKDKVLPKKDFFEEGGKGVLMQKINEAKRSNASCFMFGVAFTIFAFMLLKLI